MVLACRHNQAYNISLRTSYVCHNDDRIRYRPLYSIEVTRTSQYRHYADLRKDSGQEKAGGCFEDTKDIAKEIGCTKAAYFQNGCDFLLITPPLLLTMLRNRSLAYIPFSTHVSLDF